MNQGLEIGNGSNGVVVNGGTFSGNGTTDNLSTGGGIMLYSDVTGTGNIVLGTVIKGVVTANNNTTAGIYFYAYSGGTIFETSVGNVSGSITLSNNGSISGTYGTGGAGILVYGNTEAAFISNTNFIMSSVNGAGLVVLGIDGSGTSSPSSVSVGNSVFTGYNVSYPAITLETKTTSPGYISINPVDAFLGNTFTGTSTYAAIENIIYDKNDNSACGIVSIPNVVPVTVQPDIVFSLTTYLSFTSSVALSNVNVVVAQLLNAVNTATDGGTLVTGVTVEIPPSAGTVAGECLQLNVDIPTGANVEFKYKIQTLSNFTNTTRVQHFHNGVWTDLGRVIRYDYDTTGGSSSKLNITDVPAYATAVYAVFSTNSTSTFAFVTPSASSPLKYLTPTNAFQSATVNAAYPSSLSVTITDGLDAPVVGATVYFRRPSTGASVTFASGTGTVAGDSASAVTNASGVASVTVTANSTTGSFNVYANTANGSSPATFGLTNKAFTAAVAKVKVFLQGPYSGGGLMTTSLAAASYLPLAQPYNAAPFNYAGTEAVANAPFLVSNHVVDWVLVELRTGLGAATKVDSRAALLKNDGTLLDVDGSTGVTFNVAGAGNYYIAIKHRNHFGIISASTVALPNSPAYDFTTSQTQANGTNPMVALSDGPFGMYSGDANQDAIITAGDMSVAISALNNTGYNLTDVNFDGLVTAADISIMINNLNKTAQLAY